MHEWALAEAAISAVRDIVEKEEIKEVTEVRIMFGELQQIDRKIFEFALSQLRSPRMKKAKFYFENVPAELQCRVCSNQWIFTPENMDESICEAIHFLPEVAHSYIKCPSCGSPDFKILKGRGVWLASIKGVK